MRVFFAIEFEEEIKEYLYSVQQEVKRNCSGGNFSHKENFHLTLRFMGEQSPQQITVLKNALLETAEKLKGFELKLNKLGSFNKGNKKIIWLGLQRSGELQILYKKLEGVLEKEGYAREDRGYNPHITLVREARLDEKVVEIENINIEKLTVRVKTISLMESARVNNKLAYTAIQKAGLI
ncbi:MAG: 2-5 ligase [Eubacterium sp.]|nr:2-5 ligase [Eubacterium sp.]